MNFISLGEKLPVFAIGRSSRPRCFKGDKRLPTEYVAHSKSWMTSDMFNKLLQKLDGMFATQRRKVALIVDNCPAHKCTIALSSIELFVLPPNSTPLVQPMDAVIIRSFIANFRNELVRRRIDYFEAKK